MTIEVYSKISEHRCAVISTRCNGASPWKAVFRIHRLHHNLDVKSRDFIKAHDSCHRIKRSYMNLGRKGRWTAEINIRVRNTTGSIETKMSIQLLPFKISCWTVMVIEWLKQRSKKFPREVEKQLRAEPDNTGRVCHLAQQVYSYACKV